MSDVRTEIPKRIGRYEIIGPIGYGAMGAVYKAFDPLIKRTVAIKTLRLDVPPGSEEYHSFLERFSTEARVTGKLSHPNIVTLFDIGNTDDKVPWLAMEHVDGETVADLMDGERLPPEAVVGMVSQIAGALDYAHSEDVIHRDIKPSNLIVHDGEKVKVTDFGIARLVGDKTTSGLTMGTPSYMSPEQAMGEELDGRTDIFSLGVVAFEMLSGVQPFPGNNVTSILYKLVHADPVQPEQLEVMGLLPDKWRAVFLKVLAKDRKDRYHSAASFVHDLEMCLGSWFGAMEGETVVMESPLVGGGEASLPPGDSTLAVSPPQALTGTEQTLSAGSEPAMDQTVQFGSAEAQAIIGETGATMPAGAVYADASVDAPTAYLARPDSSETSDSDATHVVDAASVREAAGVKQGKTPLAGSVPVPPVPPPQGTPFAEGPGKAGEDALYDKTIAGSGASSSAAPSNNKAARRGTSLAVPILIGGCALVGILIVLALFLRGRRGADSEPVVSEPLVEEPVVILGRLSIVSSPEGATVHVNDVEQGVTPLEIDELQLGGYEVRVELDGHTAQSVLTELTDIEPEGMVDLTLERVAPARPRPTTGFLQIESVPSGVQVQVEGRTIGNTPIERFRVGAGERTVRLTADGFIPWEDRVRIRAGNTESIVAELSALPSAEPVVEEPIVPVEPPAPTVVEGSMVQRGDAGVEDPRCAECPVVRYPEAAKRAGVQGTVELSYTISETGTVESLTIEQSGGEILDQAVLAGVRQWQYEPATKYGVRVKMAWRQRFRFQQGK